MNAARLTALFGILMLFACSGVKDRNRGAVGAVPSTTAASLPTGAPTLPVQPGPTIPSPTASAIHLPPLGPAPTAAVDPTPFLHIFANKIVQRAWFYRPPDGADANLLRKYFDVFILSEQDRSLFTDLQSDGTASPALLYLSFDSIHDPGSCTAQPYHNQVANRPGDFCMIAQDHPDWFLRDANNNLIPEDVGGERFVLMDPRNKGWQAFWLARAEEALEQGNWDGVFLDNVEASLGKRQKVGPLPAAFPNDVAYQGATAEFLTFLYDSYFKPQQRPLLANIIELRDSAVWYRYLQHLDGAMEERFAVGWRMSYLSLPEWNEEIQRSETTQAMGKELVLVSQGPRSDNLRQQFAFASYLLIAAGRASFRYASDTAYDQVWLYPNYDLDPGTPLGPRYRQGQTWKRDFQHLSVTVDPTAHVATLIPH